MTRIRESLWISCSLLAGIASFGAAQGRPQTPDAQVDLKAPGFQEFSDRVQKYVQLHKSVEATLPKLKSTNEPELIVAHQRALARKIKAARVHAKQGDIFTRAASEAFRNAMHVEFQGPHAEHAQATMKQGAPLHKVHLRVNQTYPDSTPYTSVPPTLMQNLPKLPEEVAYRAVSRDLVLLDAKTNLVVDFLTNVIPPGAADSQ